MDFWQELRQRRLTTGFTVQALARLSGVSPAQITNIETGRTRRPRQGTQERLEQALCSQAGEAPPAQCWFCQDTSDSPRWLISSDMGTEARICDCCIRQSVALIAQGHRNIRSDRGTLRLAGHPARPTRNE